MEPWPLPASEQGDEGSLQLGIWVMYSWLTDCSVAWSFVKRNKRLTVMVRRGKAHGFLALVHQV